MPSELDFAVTLRGGLLYHFDLNKGRNQLLLEGKLKDKLANNDDESSDVIFARGLSANGISDLEVGLTVICMFYLLVKE